MPHLPEYAASLLSASANDAEATAGRGSGSADTRSTTWATYATDGNERTAKPADAVATGAATTVCPRTPTGHAPIAATITWWIGNLTESHRHGRKHVSSLL